MNHQIKSLLLLIPAILLLHTNVIATELKVAVASNFVNTMKLLASEFEQQSKVKIKLSAGSTGRHYAQIVNGAPYDIFFAADSRRPKLLEQQKISQPNTRFTYAIGKLVLITQKSFTPNLKTLKNPEIKRLSMANPKLAPYGFATQQLLKTQGYWKSIRLKIVKGENVSQALHFFKSGNAQAAFVAQSQIQSKGQDHVWLIPQNLYPVIKQQAVILSDKVAARDFIDFIKGPLAQKLISQAGYDVGGDL